MTAASEPSRIGELVGGKYRIVRLIAKGGMGIVYEAHHAVVGRRFAIKLLRHDLAERRDILTRFQREAATAGALENENVAAAIDFGVADDGTPYIVLEYLVGESLAALIEREKRLPSFRAADLIMQACRGVAAAHAAGILHRDLKPQNLFLCRRDDGADLVKVLDFGVAKLQSLDEQSAATQTGTMLGTAAYMSPEQARGEKTLDARTDVYALGAILYELVSGRRPHPGDSQNAILHHIATHPAVPLVSVQPDLPRELAEVVERALTSDREGRPSSVAALAQALAPFARREIWPACPEPSRPPTPAASEPALGAAPAIGEAASGRRRRRLLWGGALAAVLSTVAIASAVHRGGTGPVPVTAKQSPPPARRAAALDPQTRFLASEPPPGAVVQIESLLKSGNARDAALLNEMVATPAAIWFLGGAPNEVRTQVGDAVARGARQGRVPVLVAYNHPFRDCTGYGLTGAADTAAYEAWIDGFASGIGNERALVLLEPNGLGLIPYGRYLDGTEDKCKPTRAGPDGARVAPPGATPEQRYAELSNAVAVIAAKAPNALVYLDGTHSAWLPVGDAAYRLARAGVERAAGFFLNAGNFQPTARLIAYGRWIAKCLRYARIARTGASAPEAERLPRAPTPGRYAECASQWAWMDPKDDAAWAKVDGWYVEHVDRAEPPSPAPVDGLTHFVINTTRNGQGPLDVRMYAAAPYHQPAEVVETLQFGTWCMPPGRGLGIRPTAKTGDPLVDAYLWMETPGICVASCDIAGGARAWDYSRYNPWGIRGDAKSRFDPLWGRVLPPTGEWFPDEALTLARNANPPLDADEEGSAGRQAPGGARAPGVPSVAALHRVSSAAASGRPSGHNPAHGRPPGPRGPEPDTSPAAGTTGEGNPSSAGSTEEARAPSAPSFDPHNPYR